LQAGGERSFRCEKGRGVGVGTRSICQEGDSWSSDVSGLFKKLTESQGLNAVSYISLCSDLFYFCLFFSL
jgi:hypothetical protein